MRTGIRVWICGVIMLLLIAGRADAAPPLSGGPADQCAVRIEGPRITGGRKTYLWAEFSLYCKRPMAEVGAYACLQEVEYPNDPGRPVECHAIRHRPYFEGNEIVMTMIATCEYTTIPRFYYVSGYGWAIFLPTDGGQSGRSPGISSYNPLHPSTLWRKAIRAKGNVRYCHISAKNMRWREAK